MPDNLTELLDTLRLQFFDRLLTSDAAREHHGSGESHLPPAWPDAVVMVTSTQDVSDVLTACTKHGVPVTVLSRLRSGLSTHLCGLSFECQGAFSAEL